MGPNSAFHRACARASELRSGPRSREPRSLLPTLPLAAYARQNGMQVSLVLPDGPPNREPSRVCMPDLRSILQAFPAGTKLVVVAAELPDGSRELRVVGGEGNTTSQATLQAPEASRAGSGAQEMALDELLLDRLQQLREQRGNVALKPKEWSQITRISARELRRAICAGAVPHEAKEDGRDHGAKLITVEAMLGYLATVFAVERGRMDAPAWWAEVRGRRAAA